MDNLSVIDPRFLYDQVNAMKAKGDLEKVSSKGEFQKIIDEKKQAEQKRLKEVSYQMESIFINMMLKEMRKGLNKYRLIPENPAEKIFNDMLYEEYSLKLARSGQLGLAKSIYEQYSKYI